MPFFSKVFKSKDSNATKGQRPLDRTSGGPVAPAKPRWGDDAWTMKSVEPQEVQELLHFCTQEAKSRGTILDIWPLPLNSDILPSTRHAVLAPPVQTRLRSQLCQNLYTELFQVTL